MARREGCAVHAYVLMTNHVHLLLTPGNGDGGN
jgi:putative transposase